MNQNSVFKYFICHLVSMQSIEIDSLLVNNNEIIVFYGSL